MISSILQFVGGLVLLAWFAANALGIVIVINPIAIVICALIGFLVAGFVRFLMTVIDPFAILMLGAIVWICGAVHLLTLIL